MALTDTQIKKIKTKDKPYKVSDGGGLYGLRPGRLERRAILTARTRNFWHFHIYGEMV